MCKFSRCFPFANWEASEEQRKQVSSCNGRGERAAWKPDGAESVKQGPEDAAEDARGVRSSSGHPRGGGRPHQSFSE